MSLSLQPSSLLNPAYSGVQASLQYLFAQTGSLLPSRGTALITFTRASSGTYFDSTGTLQTALTDAARFDYNPSTLIARGLLIEEARTNSIRNNTMAGASAGTPGTLPTNWTTFTTLTGLTRTVVGTGTENGISYVDIQLSGTPSAAGSYYISYESSTQIAASNGQSWTASTYYKLSAGTLTGITLNNTVSQRDVGGAELGNVKTTFVPTSAALSTQRTATSLTNNSASTAFELQYVELVLSGVAIDITLRIGMPQLELGAFATSVISTSSAAVTRAADVASITGSNFTSFWNATQGTIVVGFMNEAAVTAATFPTVVRASDGTSNNFITVNQISTNNRTYAAGTTGGVAQWDINSSSGTYNTTALTAYKAAIAYQANNIGYSLSGTAAGTDTSATIPTVDRLEIGSANSSGFVNGWISSLSYYPVRDGDTLLQRQSL